MAEPWEQEYTNPLSGYNQSLAGASAEQQPTYAPTIEPDIGGFDFVGNYSQSLAGESKQSTAFQEVVDNAKGFMQKNGGEIFAKTMMYSAAGVLQFLAQRRAQRATSEENDKERAYKREEIARASSMPIVTSVVKPGVSGKQAVGNQGGQGLISNVRQRG